MRPVGTLLRCSCRLTVFESCACTQALARLRDGLAGGDAYEAQQTVKTAYYRLKARGQLQDSYELLQQAAGEQFRAGQFTCGLELAKLLVEVSAAMFRTMADIGRLQCRMTVGIIVHMTPGEHGVDTLASRTAHRTFQRFGGRATCCANHAQFACLGCTAQACSTDS